MTMTGRIDRPQGGTATAAAGTDPDSYYGYPALKKPTWTWEIPAYFFTGGLASGAYVAATLADLFGTQEDRAVSRAGRYVALLALAISPILLILDLGRPERFHHMLRILKYRSPMNMGTWGLTGFGLFAALGVLRQWVEDGLVSSRSPAARLLAWVPLQVSGVVGTLFAFFVGSYTGVLLSFTNSPIWAKNRLYQGPLFLTSALSTGLAAITLWLSGTGELNRRTAGWLRRAEDVVTLGELAFTASSLSTLGSAARPLTTGRYRLPFWLGAVGMGMVTPSVIRRVAEISPWERRPPLDIAASLSVLAGGFLFRWAESHAGQDSIDDPRYYFDFARNRD